MEKSVRFAGLFRDLTGIAFGTSVWFTKKRWFKYMLNTEEKIKYFLPLTHLVKQNKGRALGHVDFLKENIQLRFFTYLINFV